MARPLHNPATPSPHHPARNGAGVSTSLWVIDTDLEGRQTHLHVVDGRIAAIESGLRPPLTPADSVLDAHGGAVLPGLHDHHLHLVALAANLDSVDIGPPFASRTEVTGALRSTPGEGWIRAVGYHESVCGPLDRHVLDTMVADRPVRVQHRSGAEWVLNSRAIEVIGLDDMRCEGVEREHEHDIPTGRIRGLDDLLRRRWGQSRPDLRRVGELLAGHGVTGVTDATPYDAVEDLTALVDAVPQRVMVMGGPGIDVERVDRRLTIGPAKIVVADHALPSLDDLSDRLRLARRRGRNVAVHCVTRIGLVLALAAWDEVGAETGDRIEHGAVIDAGLAARVAELGLTVVTQPNFVAERGDRYLDDVDTADVDHLYPCGSLLAAGIRVGGSTDAPFGRPDPWAAMRAAVDRTASDGRVVGARERIDRRAALRLFLTDPSDPGGVVRTLEVGAPADLCVLDRPWQAALNTLRPSVVATIVGGRIVHGSAR